MRYRIQGYFLQFYGFGTVDASDSLSEALASLAEHRNTDPINSYRLVEVNDQDEIIVLIDDWQETPTPLVNY